MPSDRATTPAERRRYNRGARLKIYHCALLGLWAQFGTRWLIMWQRLSRTPDWQFVGLCSLVFVGLQWIGTESFRFQSDWFGSGQIWRLITAHWTHLGWIHLLLNLFGLVVCVILTRPNWSLLRWSGSCFVIAAGSSVLLTLLNTELTWYLGFSGVLYGLYFLAAVDLFQRDRLIAVLILIAISTKVVIEQISPLDFSTAGLIGAPVVVDAHLYGMLVAMPIAIALIWSRYTMNHGSTGHSKSNE